MVVVMALGLVIVPSSPIQAQAVGPVYALRGTLRPVANRTYDTIMTIGTGAEYGLVGQTPEVELQIVQLRGNGPTFAVKVWGDRYPAATEGELEIIVVSSILPADPPPPTATPVVANTPVPAPTNTPAPTNPPAPQATSTPALPYAVINAAAVNVRNGPDTTYPPIGSLVAGQVCSVIGRNEASTWWMLACPGGMTGWVFGQLIALGGPYNTVRVVPVAPPPTPVPPTTYAGWKSSFFANRELAGNPVVVLDLPNINYQWGNGAPAGNVPADNWSARFERTLDFAAGAYEITVNVDDGFRLFINDQRMLDDWNVGSPRIRLLRMPLSGSHRFRLEYFEASGGATLQFSVRLISSSNSWQATYFNNPNLSGNPVVTRGEPAGEANRLDFNWGLGSPAPGVEANQWSARWVGNFYFEGGDYRFRLTVDDGARVYIDGIRILEVWEPGWHNDLTNDFRNIGRGNHQIVVEYYDAASLGMISMRWDALGGGSGGSGNNSGGGGRAE
jgi:uncharacterized protein YraI